MGKLITIDNGGTLTDICVFDGAAVWRTKTLTTPHDLSECLMAGLTRASAAVFGEADLGRLLLSTDNIRYSTTQGTNALVERRGARLGLISSGIDAAALSAANPALYAALVGNRCAEVPVAGDESRLDAVRAVSDLVARGANRIVVAFDGDGAAAGEAALKRALLRAFPQHLLGAVPVLFARELANDGDAVRRTWTGLFNAFLHPAMERFLYAAERKLRDARAQSPLLVFRNDGQSARVAKTVAIKTYGSGPRGGADGSRELARHYGFAQLISLDVGGTTTDVAVVDDGNPRSRRHGRIEGVATSFPLADVVSFGVGGSSVIRVADGSVIAGPDSVGSAPGPACFGLGGTAATVTDALFAAGLLDPASYFGGGLRIDLDRARAAVDRAVAGPLGISSDDALAAVEAAWTRQIADGVRGVVTPNGEAAIAAFGGAGPLLVCAVADRLGVTRVLIPKLAAVFSAFGIGFSDIGHDHETPLGDAAATLGALRQQARRGMTAEGIDPVSCDETISIVTMIDGSEVVTPFTSSAASITGNAALRLNVTSRLAHPVLCGKFGGTMTPAASAATRAVLIDGQCRTLTVYRVEDLPAGAAASGPAVLEEEYFTCRVDAGWRFETNAAGDILLTREGTA